VYISFPSAFWDGEAAPSPSSSTISVSDTTSDASAAATTLHPAVTTYLPATTAADRARPITEEALSLSRLPPPHAHPTLLFYTTARTSARLSARLPPRSPFVSRCPAADPEAAPLLAHFAPLLARLPRPHHHHYHRHGDPTPPPPAPSALLATNWAADELAGFGSYTFFPAGLAAGDADVEALRRGAASRGVWIAGEHAAPFVALGTLTGAWWSGERVAERILGIVDDGEGREDEDEDEE
jgi:hypothetical protein